MVTTAGHAVAAFHFGGEVRPAASSIGDQQGEMALRACHASAEGEPAPSATRRGDLLCPHCGAPMRLIEDWPIGPVLHLSAECRRCGCLRASYVELSPAPQPFLEPPQEASFD
jgi:hypothetical protein